MLQQKPTKPILKPVLVLKPVKPDIYHLDIARFAAENLRGWHYRDLRKLCEKLPNDPESRQLVLWIKLTWIKLKLVVSSFHELKDYVWKVWKNCLVPEGQESYKEAMDEALTSRKVALGVEDSSGPIPKQCDLLMVDFIWMLKSIDPRLWVPLTTFPLWDVVSEGKMHLAFVPEPSSEKAEEVRKLVHSFLRKYAPKETFIPSDLALKKVGVQKYNDGGLVKRDSERPEISYSSGFLYQKFITKPLQTREVWLPGKAIKDNNAWWFVIIDGILRKVPYSALLKESIVIYNEIKSRLKSEHIMFDVSGYGIQFPRNFLSVALEEVADTYPELKMKAAYRIALEIFSKVEIQMDTGIFKYPPRGIGLGYYENLKTMIVMAIIDDCNPISVYGDQAILEYSDASKLAIKRLEDLGFLFTKPEKKLYTTSRLKWSGQIMSKRHGFHEPRTVWTNIFGAFGKMFHWERKAALSGVTLDPEYEHVLKRVTFQYEKTFGYEFFRGESQMHPDNGGILGSSPRQSGFQKTWKISKLSTPSTVYKDGLFYNIPYSEKPELGAAKKFSKLRTTLYKKTKPFDLRIVDYVHPLIEMNNKRKPHLSAFARSMPLWAEIRNFVFNGTTTGKLASGLSPEDTLLAPLRQRYAPDVFRARATGGYRIITDYHGTRGADEEFEYLALAINYAEEMGFETALRRDRIEKLRATNPYVLEEDEEIEVKRILDPDNEEMMEHFHNLLNYNEETVWPPQVDALELDVQDLDEEQEVYEILSTAIDSPLNDVISDLIRDAIRIGPEDWETRTESEFSNDEPDQALAEFDLEEVEGSSPPTISGWRY